MYSKARVFHDYESLEKIMEATHPRQMKELGRTVKNFVKEEWDSVSSTYVFIGNYNRFSQNEDEKELLFSTYPMTLVEASPYDKIWGIGLSENDPRTLNKESWLGENRLGYVLTEVRNILYFKNQVNME